jgi:hypothetical protein
MLELCWQPARVYCSPRMEVFWMSSGTSTTLLLTQQHVRASCCLPTMRQTVGTLALMQSGILARYVNLPCTCRVPECMHKVAGRKKVRVPP